MEYLKDYDFYLKYHPGKDKKVVCALSWKEIRVAELMVLEFELLEKFRNLDLQFKWVPSIVLINNLNVENVLQERICQTQCNDIEFQAKESLPDFSRATNGVILFKDRVCVPSDV